MLSIIDNGLKKFKFIFYSIYGLYYTEKNYYIIYKNKTKLKWHEINITNNYSYLIGNNFKNQDRWKNFVKQNIYHVLALDVSSSFLSK